MAQKKACFPAPPQQVAASYRATIQRIPLAVQQVEVPTIRETIIAEF